MKLVLIYLLIINIIAIVTIYIDKQRAINHKWRIKEATLINISILGGSIGMLIGMNSFRHKTKHKLFTVGVPAILIIQVLIITFIMSK